MRPLPRGAAFSACRAAPRAAARPLSTWRDPAAVAELLAAFEEYGGAGRSPPRRPAPTAGRPPRGAPARDRALVGRARRRFAADGADDDDADARARATPARPRGSRRRRGAVAGERTAGCARASRGAHDPQRDGPTDDDASAHLGLLREQLRRADGVPRGEHDAGR